MTKLSRRILQLAVAALLLVAIQTGPGLGQDLTGQWTITAGTKPRLDSNDLTCNWTGVWNLTDTGGTVTGTVTLNLVSGDDGCPDPMTSMLTAKNVSGKISGTIGGPSDNLGEISFSGSLDSSTQKTAATAATSASGSFSVVSRGMFAGQTGTFSGTLAPVMPDLPQLALLALLLALFAGGSLFLLRRRRV